MARRSTPEDGGATLDGEQPGLTPDRSADAPTARMYSPLGAEVDEDDESAEYETRAMASALRRQEIGDYGTDRGVPVNPRIFDHKRMKLVEVPGENPPPYLVSTVGAVVQERPELERHEAFERQFYDWATDAAARVTLRFEDKEELIEVLGDPWAEGGGSDTRSAPDNAKSAATRQVPQVGSAEAAHLQQRFRSADWTGIERRVAATPGAVEAVTGLVTELDLMVEKCGLTNLEQQRAKALTGALVKLVASPEPEWQIIVQILNSPVFTALWRIKEIAFLLCAIIWWLVGES